MGYQPAANLSVAIDATCITGIITADKIQSGSISAARIGDGNWVDVTTFGDTEARFIPGIQGHQILARMYSCRYCRRMDRGMECPGCGAPREG